MLTISSNAHPPTATYTLSLHDALPISEPLHARKVHSLVENARAGAIAFGEFGHARRNSTVVRFGEGNCGRGADRKSTRLNSSHRTISYAVFCLKKKKEKMYNYVDIDSN